MQKKDCLNEALRGGTAKPPRESGIELMRILMMLVIIAHHYVVNSGLLEVMEEDILSWKSMILLIFGWGGKCAINCFVLITGYFMCTQKITSKKFLKLLLEIEFYNIGIGGIFLLSGYSSFSMKTMIRTILPIYSIGTSFTESYLIFFLLIPFLNLLIQKMDEQQHIRIMSLCFMVFTILPSFFKANVKIGYVGWFAIVYIFASYVRLHPKKWFEDSRMWGSAALFLILLSCGSVAACAWLCTYIGKSSYYFFVNDCNKILAILPALATFMFFKNFRIGYRKWINTMAAATFGVLLIHANSDTMRQWLWRDILKNKEAYYSQYLVLHMVLSVIGIYLVCAAIDLIRIHFLEKPIEKKCGI